MSDEIKEILDNLKPKYDIVDENGNDYKKIKFKECKKLLDYITNLQQKYEGAILIGKELNRDNNRLRIIEEKYKDSQEYVVAFKKEIEDLQQEIDRLNNITNELEKTIENRLMAVPDDVLDDGIEEIKRTTKIAVYQVILGDLYKLKELKENNNAKD